jgi:AsmA protein
LGVVFIAPLFISTQNLQQRALAQVESATGYRIRIDGPVKIAVFPSLDLVARDVGIAQPDQGGQAEFATVRTLRFGLVLRSLLAGKVNFSDVTLIDPVIKLPLPEKASPRSTEPEGKADAGRDLTIHELTIRNGTVILPGENSEPDKQIASLNVKASLPTAKGPLTFNATARYDGDPVSTRGSIGSFSHFIDGGPVPVKLVLDMPDLPDGATLTSAASYKDGTLTLEQFAVQSGPHKVSGNATYRDDLLTIAEGMFDDTPFAGTAELPGDTLTVNTEISVEGKPVRLAGSLDGFDRFLAGGEAPIKLHVVAPEHIKDEVSLNGTVSYKDDALILPKFTAVSGEDTMSGAAVYKDDVLTLSQVTATFGDQTVTGDATYRGDAVDLDVTVEFDGKPAKVTGSITGVEKLIDGAPASIKLQVESPDRLPATALVTGDAVYKDAALVLNAFTAVSGDYTVTGNGVYKDDVLVLDPVRAQTSGQTVSGTLAVNLAGNVPSVSGKLTATGAVKAKGDGAPASKEIAQTQEAAESKPVPAPAEPTANPLAQPPGGVEVAVAPPPKPRESVPGEPATSAKPTKPRKRPRGLGWRVEKLGFLALKDLNADLNLTLNQFDFEDIRIKAATVKVTLVGGKLTAETKDLKAYGGGGSMTLVLNANGAHSLNLVVAGLDAYPFLRDVADFHTIEGKAAIALALTASGDSERAMVASLNGTAKFEFTEGALRGINVANMLRNLTTGILTGWQYKQDTKTVFNKLSASFKVANGQAQTDDLRLLGPLVSVGGAGTVDIPAHRLKFRVNPFMLASVKSQSGKSNILGFPVPIAVLGPWDNPSIYPDIVGVLENPVAAYQQLNKLGGGLIAMPANILGVDTGDGGLVEKSIAIPGAVTKGVVGGIGQMLGVKKPNDPEAMPSVPANQPSDTAPRAIQAPPKKPTAEAGRKEQSAAEPTPNQTFQNMFGQ